ncbi:putative peptide transporter [Lachnellula occidentalis]|uniref:Putative peptide transporter n=1 Tax=Lachnellula occidentalis TaxID=215460 RepID=A0A8H8S508_9HELO|nr:putative peptide transporter [Lachnellula occidentalis]
MAPDAGIFAPDPQSPDPEKEMAVAYPYEHNHSSFDYSFDDDEAEFPTRQERRTLRRVPDKIPWMVYTVAFIELVERFSFYGTIICYTNFIQQPLPDGSRTGAGGGGDYGQSGALNMGQRASTGITTFNSFWVFVIPLFGAYVADVHWGRFKTICIALAVAILGHIILVISAIPDIITRPKASLPTFIVGLVLMGLGTGSFKPNISPLIVEQLPNKMMTIKVLPSGERVIVDPTATQSRVYHYFYLFINIGSMTGVLGMTYSEKYLGYWITFLLPTGLILLCPVVLWFCRNKYVRTPPQGSVLGKALRIFLFANKGRWSLNPLRTYRNLHDGTFWDSVKPSYLGPSFRPSWMTFDDQWVDEVARGFGACSVFCWYPLYWITYNQLFNNFTSQAAVLNLGGVPNDLIQFLDPIIIMILIPFCDLLVYPALRKAKIRFTPIRKITVGFFMGSMAMVWAAVIQAYIYKTSICGNYASGALPAKLGGDGWDYCPPIGLTVWAQTGAYVLIGISEIFASITSLEYAFSKAPVNMRSLVMAFAMFMSGIAPAIGEGFSSLSTDPLLVWNYGSMAVLSFLGGVGFWFTFRDLDIEEDDLNMLPAGNMDLAQSDSASETRSMGSTMMSYSERGSARRRGSTAT